MSDFKTLEQVAMEMEEERQKPRRPPQNAAEVNAAMIEYRRREREKLAKAQEQPKEGTEQPQGHPEELGLSYPEVKIPLSNGYRTDGFESSFVVGVVGHLLHILHVA